MLTVFIWFSMDYGFTTGSCAAAASKAAAYMLLSGKEKNRIEIDTPKGLVYKADVLEIQRGDDSVSCAVKKDGGDDPDITTGALIFATVSFAEISSRERGGWDENPKAEGNRIEIDGGEGVGRVTRAGLDQPPGNAAINHVPREMITKEVSEVCELFDYRGSLSVIISVPEGRELALKTFNPRIGIEGGISIIGTSGVVEPMSRQALIDTIRVELNVRRAAGFDTAFISPGNYGLEYMKKAYGYDLDRSVKCSNFIGETIDILVELGFKRVLLTGHIGKLIKVAGGIMNTHSRESDSRMELLAAFSARCGLETGALNEILSCYTTEEALEIIKRHDKLDNVMQYTLDRILFYLDKRAGGRLEIECILYSNDFGELARSDGARRMLYEV